VLDSLITCNYNIHVICNCAESVINKFKFKKLATPLQIGYTIKCKIDILGQKMYRRARPSLFAGLVFDVYVVFATKT